MKKLLEQAQNKLREACKGCEDVCSVRYHLGYIQAIKDIDKKLKTEGIDKLEDE